MIRDPSDGTVRPAPPWTAEELEVMRKRGQPIPDTGLRQPTRTDAQERMERSREWLKQYQKAVRDANSMNDKGEVTNARGSNDGEERSTDRDSSDGEG